VLDSAEHASDRAENGAFCLTQDGADLVRAWKRDNKAAARLLEGHTHDEFPRG
jgi:hypothetical protein